ncbi:MAG: GNAT family N-acetyltransferase [Bacteroidales bacterium]|nr:GNAT family N-acetyltransferase [Bacteroidales bacterium]
MNIKLEIPTLGDAKIIAEYANNRNIWLNVTDSFPHPYFKENAIDFINIIQQQNPITTFKVLKDKKFVGFVGLMLKEGIYYKNAEIGYWIAEPFWRQGIATEAVNLILKFAFETFKEIEKIYAKVYHTNIGSMRALEKNGFKKEAIHKKEAFKAGEFKDLHFFSIFREDFK